MSADKEKLDAAICGPPVSIGAAFLMVVRSGAIGREGRRMVMLSPAYYIQAPQGLFGSPIRWGERMSLAHEPLPLATDGFES